MPRENIQMDKLWEVLFAGGFGAFIAGMADKFKNQSESSIGELAKFMDIGGGLGEIMVLLVLAVLGVAFSWIYRPATKMDAFVRGLAILSVIGITSKNDLPNHGQDTQERESYNITSELKTPLLASLNYMAIPKNAEMDLCPVHKGTFNPNAKVIGNTWISSSKPETKFYSFNIYTQKCGNVLSGGQQIQLIDYYRTTFSGYYYVKVIYQDGDGILRVGWIYSGRDPNYWQEVQPDNFKLNPLSLGGE